MQAAQSETRFRTSSIRAPPEYTYMSLRALIADALDLNCRPAGPHYALDVLALPLSVIHSATYHSPFPQGIEYSGYAIRGMADKDFDND